MCVVSGWPRSIYERHVQSENLNSCLVIDHFRALDAIKNSGSRAVNSSYILIKLKSINYELDANVNQKRSLCKAKCEEYSNQFAVLCYPWKLYRRTLLSLCKDCKSMTLK